MATRDGGSDRTAYGISRTATRHFFTHHLRAMSAAVAWGVGEAVVRAARHRKGDLARPLSEWMPHSCLLGGRGTGAPGALTAA